MLTIGEIRIGRKLSELEERRILERRRWKDYYLGIKKIIPSVPFETHKSYWKCHFKSECIISMCVLRTQPHLLTLISSHRRKARGCGCRRRWKYNLMVNLTKVTRLLSSHKSLQSSVFSIRNNKRSTCTKQKR